MSHKICCAAWLVAAAVVGCGASAPARAGELTDAEARALFNTIGCNACHERSELRIGPSYQMVAGRYQAVESAVTIERLSLKIRHGGAGAWGVVPMISHPNLSLDTARAMARWILAGRELGPGDAGRQD